MQNAKKNRAVPLTTIGMIKIFNGTSDRSQSICCRGTEVLVNGHPIGTIRELGSCVRTHARKLRNNGDKVTEVTVTYCKKADIGRKLPSDFAL